MQGAEDAAAEYGATIQIFNGEFDSEKQVNQVTGAITSGDFDGFVLEANNAQQLCSAAEATLEAGIALAVTNVPVCERNMTPTKERRSSSAASPLRCTHNGSLRASSLDREGSSRS